MTDLPRIIFIDIDGVLLSSRAWRSPANANAREFRSAWRWPEAQDAAVFDAEAVAWLNRMCSDVGAQVVLISSWRMSFGMDATAKKLVAQGVERRHLHAVPCAPFYRLTGTKLHHASDWAIGADLPWRDLSTGGSWFMVLDDEPIRGMRNQVQPDPEFGIAERDYWAAMTVLGAAGSR